MNGKNTTTGSSGGGSSGNNDGGGSGGGSVSDANVNGKNAYTIELLRIFYQNSNF